mgnify:CR=1 FL=1
MSPEDEKRLKELLIEAYKIFNSDSPSSFNEILKDNVKELTEILDRNGIL